VGASGALAAAAAAKGKRGGGGGNSRVVGASKLLFANDFAQKS
jgi:hypothetical protein